MCARLSGALEVAAEARDRRAGAGLRQKEVDLVEVKWEMLESGPADAERTVLLLPGGLNTARSYAELMASRHWRESAWWL